MKYIEIAEGLSIKIDEIEAIGYGKNELTSKVYTHHNTYSSTFPYEILLELLENSYLAEKEESKPQEEALNIFREIGTFAG